MAFYRGSHEAQPWNSLLIQEFWKRENLKKDLLGKLDHMEELVAFVEKRSPEIMKEYRSKLESKVKELLGDTTIDESRIATEVIIYADKICVDEETVRLRSHIEHARKCLNEEARHWKKDGFHCTGDEQRG